MTQVPADAQSRFLDNLPYIERVLAGLSRRLGLRGDDADDFSSWAKARLIEDGYSVLAKFRGESSITTYLTVVLAMLGREFQVQRHGRWRPSAAARRSGSLAVRLETLVYRDHVPLSQAAEQLRTRGETTMADRELAQLLGALPRRTGGRPKDAGDVGLESAVSSMRADDIVEAENAARDRERAGAALTAAIERLSTEDRLIVRLRFWEELSIADISRTLGVPQKPLYRRLERVLVGLRRDLENAGVSQELTRALTSADELDSQQSVRPALSLSRAGGPVS